MIKLYGSILSGLYKCRFYFKDINQHPQHQIYGIELEAL